MLHTRLTSLLLAVVLVSAVRPIQAQDASSQLEKALIDMYGICLFNGESNNPFSQAAALATGALAPGLSNFVESNLASIPLTPPSLEIAERDGEFVNVVTGFTPIFTESVGTVGKGQFLVGTNASYFNLSRIRGQEISDIAFTFGQNGFVGGGGDQVVVTMPLDIQATVFTLYGTYGITNRFDIGFAFPIVRLDIENEGTLFEVVGNRTGCNYANGAACDGGNDPDITVSLNESFGLPSSETYLSTMALRAKYRFTPSQNSGDLAAVFDVRIPTRSDDSLLGSGNFGWSFTLIGEYDRLVTFKPYFNLGARAWNGAGSNSLRFASGFTQQIMPNKLFFAFDLLAEMDLEDDVLLGNIDDDLTFEGTEIALLESTLPSVSKDHTLNAGLGLQFAPTPSIHVYGSALFALLDRGLQSPVTPVVGAAIHF